MRLETVLANTREEASALRLHGHQAQAASLDRVADAVAECLAAHLDWLSESEARLRSGKGVAWFRARFPGWADPAVDLAEWRGRTRYYRRVVVPRRANREAARAEAIRDARGSAA